MPHLNIVIPNYNYGRFLPECVRSIAELRIPAGWRLSVVFVDDASTDDSVAVWEQERPALEARGISTATVLRQVNGGTASALNSGVQVVPDADWVMPLAADDEVLPHAIEELFLRIEHCGCKEKPDVVPFGYEAFGVVSDGSRPATGTRLYERHGDGSGRAYVQAFLRGERISSGCSPFRRVWWERFGFPEHLRKSEDTAFWMRLAAHGAIDGSIRFEPSKRPCVRVRYHPNRKSFDHQNHPSRDERVRQIRQYMNEPEPVDFLASERHFVDHLAPVWRALPPALRGRFLVPTSLLSYAAGLGVRAVSYGSRLADSQRTLATGRGPVVSAASGNQVQVARAGRISIFCEHGAGQSYRNNHSSYAGFRGRKGVALFLCPGPHPAARNRAAYPNTPVIDVGVPKLDPWHRGEIPLPQNERPVVAISFHWDCLVCPETRSSFQHFEPALQELAAAEDFQLIGHGHPRIIEQLRPVYERLGIEVVENFDEVLRRADCYAVDNSSTLFEFAATGRPVVVLNAPWYRRDVRHGLRFWEAADVGVQVDHPRDLLAGIREALLDAPARQAARRRALALVYSHVDGRAAERAATMIERVTRQLADPSRTDPSRTDPSRIGARPNVHRAIPHRTADMLMDPSAMKSPVTNAERSFGGHTAHGKMEKIQMIATASFRNRGRAENTSRPNPDGRIVAGDHFNALGDDYARELERKGLAARRASKPTSAPGRTKAPSPVTTKPTAQPTAQPTAPVPTVTPKPAAPDRSKPQSDGPSSGERLEDLSRADLYELAKKADIPGRSGMDKEALIEALRKAGVVVPS